VDYAATLDCIHCGLCLETCPTYRLTGQETSSPRGRIHLMRAVAEGRLRADAAYADELEFCLLCRHCESVCPAGVRFGGMMEFARAGLADARPARGWRRLLRWLAFRALLPSRLALRLAGSLLRAAQILRLDRLAERLWPGRGFATLPRIPPLTARRLLPRRIAAAGAARLEVALLEGCVMAEFYARVNRATARSLARLGADVRVPALTCCGSLHAHNGDRVGARRLARALVTAWEEVGGAQAEPRLLVVNSAGCGAHLKELHHLFEPDDPWHARARRLAASTRDYSEVVAPLFAEAPRRAPALPQPVAWDDPCHLCHAQGLREPPRSILAAIPGLQRVELADSESCCGSAGIYALTRPRDSRAILARKRADLERSGARTLVTANPGCMLQWQSGLAGTGDEVLHLAELVDASLARPD
jgi:glycolate oxidase iron-sulfur subunit